MQKVDRNRLLMIVVAVPALIFTLWVLHTAERLYPPVWQDITSWSLIAAGVVSVAGDWVAKRWPRAKTVAYATILLLWAVGVIWPLARYGLFGGHLVLTDEGLRRTMRLLWEASLYAMPVASVYLLWRIAVALERIAKK